MRRSSARPSAAATRSRASLAGTSRSSVPWPMSRRRGGTRLVAWIGSIATTSRRRASASRRSPSSPTTPATWTEWRNSWAGPHHGPRWAGAAKVATPRTAEAETRERDLSAALGDALEDAVEVLAPLGRRERPRAGADARERARGHHPARLVGQVLGQLGEQPRGLTAHPHGPRQAVHEDERVTRDGPVGRGRDAKVEQGTTADQLLGGEHAARCPGAGPAALGGTRDRPTATRSSWPA